MSRVILGLADRPQMDHTLGWAITEAVTTGADLVIVRAEVHATALLTALARGAGAALAEADPALARAVATARRRLGDDRVAVTADRDSAGAVLVAAAHAGDLLV